MHSQFFPKNENLSTENNFKRFLENYPEKEFWRFFVERDRYDRRESLYHILYQKLNKVSLEDAKKISVQIIEDNVSSLTIGNIYEVVTDMDDIQTLEALDNHFHLKNRKAEILGDVINRNQGWVGFEDNEPGYLTNITNAFNYILKNSVDKKKLDLDFIKEIHKLATQNVKNMLEGTTPGEFRKNNARWDINQVGDSLDGLKENMDYLKTLELEWNNPGILIYTRDSDKIVKRFNTFITKDTQDLAAAIWSLVKPENEVYYHTTDATKIDTSKDFLTIVSNRLLDELDKALIAAHSKEEKLTAIFTYLKRSVLHHVFDDGVGRTFSMLLLQYLLIKEDLLPVLIKNSNFIPGLSVKELVDEYLRAEKEMELILKDPDYINSKDIVEKNVNSDDLLKSLPQHEQDMFLENLAAYKNTKKDCLAVKQDVQLKL